MNRLTCIGNLVRDPECRIVKNRKGETSTVVSFTVAANNGWGEYQTTLFVKVNAWNGLGETCKKYLQKGSKVYVSGVPSLNLYVNNNGEAAGNIEITHVDEIEFLTKKDSIPYQPVEENDEDIEELL